VTEASAKRLIKDADLDWETCGEALRILAKKAVTGSAADMNAFLRQTEELKPNPKHKSDDNQDMPELVITGETVDEINKTLEKIDGIIERIEAGEIPFGK